MKKHLVRWLIILCAVGATLMADEKADIARRMTERLPQIDALKERQVVGENNRGLLEARGQATSADRQIVGAENQDRGAVYAIIARETGSTPEAVGRLRARKIAENSKAGVWLQDEGGRWYRK